MLLQMERPDAIVVPATKDRLGDAPQPTVLESYVRLGGSVVVVGDESNYAKDFLSKAFGYDPRSCDAQ
jgi:hypothetical protein